MTNQVDISHLVQPAFNPSYNHPPKPNLSLATNIPPEVVAAIIEVYENKTLQDLKKAPNNLICKADGSFWTTWNFVFWLKTQQKNKVPILFTSTGDPYFGSGVPAPEEAKRVPERAIRESKSYGEPAKHVDKSNAGTFPRDLPRE